jgi:hypothetical protein
MAHMKAIVSIFLIILAISTVAPAKVSIPMAERFRGWKFDPDYQADGKDLATVKKISIACEDKSLSPAHPQQDTKQYHLATFGEYGKGGLVRGGADGPFREICQTWSLARKPDQRTCLRFKVLKFVILSDVYQDHCGHFYRGYFQKMFSTNEETMGTLVSPGKTFYEKSDSAFSGGAFSDVYVGGTYPVKDSDFLFFGDVFPGDLDKVRQGIQMAISSGQIQDPSTGLFSEPSRH